jgi:putative ABC transport system substrate-binding protein
MKALALLVTLTLSLLMAPYAVEAQQPTKVHRIGWLRPGSPPSGPDSAVEDFRQGLRDLGYVEGQNLRIEYRYAEGSEERLRDLATELVRLPVEVIVAGGSAPTRAAQRATRTIPIVMNSGEPVGLGFVASLARPGGNITGVSNFSGDLPGKQLELLKEVVPQSARIAVLTNPAHPSHGPEMAHLAVAAKALGVQLHVVPLHRPDELGGAFAAMTREDAEALVVLGEPLLIDHIIRAIRGPRGPAPAARHLPLEHPGAGWRPHVLWAERVCHTTALGVLRGSHPERCQARGPTRGATDEIRASHQSEDGQSSRPDDTPDAAAPS